MKGKHNRTRSNFLEFSGLAGASASMGALHAVAIAAPPMMGDVSAKKVRSCCTVECLHHNLTAHVVNNKVVNVVSSPDNDTKACARGISRAKYLYNPKRVLYPMLQTGEKGNLSTFKKISWNEAFDLIEKNLKNTIKKFGNKAIYFSSMTGNMDSTGGAFGAAFFNRLGGYTTRSGSMCCGVISYLMPQMLGQRYVDTRDTVADSKYLLCWGNNPVVTLQAYYKNFVHAMDKGAKMVTIDPRYSETAAKSDEWVQIIPGTDAALALGMLNHIIKNKLYDEKFLLEHSGAT